MQRGTSADELRGWRMAPFIDAVLLQPRSHFLLRTSARLLRCAVSGSRGNLFLHDYLQLFTVYPSSLVFDSQHQGRCGAGVNVFGHSQLVHASHNSEANKSFRQIPVTL